MAQTVQQVLDDINLRYRNTFTTSQVLVWFNEEQRELFDILELDSPPYTFQTVEGDNFYPFPDGMDVTKIKTVTYQYDTTAEPTYVEVPFKRNDDDQYAAYGPWYTIVSNAMYLYVPDSVPADRNVYIYTDSDPTQVTTDNLNVSPDLPTKYQEILKLGVLKRIAGARKDIVFQNNFDQEREQKIVDVLWQRKLAEPDWMQPADQMPHAGNPYGYGGLTYRFPYFGG